MARARGFRRRLLLATAVAGATLTTSGCVVLEVGGTGAYLGTPETTVVVCGSSSTLGTACRNLGNSHYEAKSGLYQVLLAAQIPDYAGAPTTITSGPPASLAFAASPGYAAELQRLDPAPSGRRWVGWISPTVNYNAAIDTFDAQRLAVSARWPVPPAADGSPSAIPTLTAGWAVGFRTVSTAATPQRPVACGDSLTLVFKDLEDPVEPGWTYCLDSRLDITAPVADLGIVTSGSRASGTPGGLVSMPFVLRNSNAIPGAQLLPARATSTLPGATLAVTPEALPQPFSNGDTTAVVAVGIPAGTTPGVYDVTLTVDLSTIGPGLTRAGVGKLTVLPAPAGGGGTAGGGAGGGGAGGGGAGGKRRFTAILPVGQTVASALTDGVRVLLGSTVAGPAVVRLQQGPRKRPTLSIGKRVRLKSPGPVKVTFHSHKLAKGPYRISVSVAGKVVKNVRGRLAK